MFGPQARKCLSNGIWSGRDTICKGSLDNGAHKTLVFDNMVVV